VHRLSRGETSRKASPGGTSADAGALDMARSEAFSGIDANPAFAHGGCDGS
jgi:hypothetical protein